MYFLVVGSAHSDDYYYQQHIIYIYSTSDIFTMFSPLYDDNDKLGAISKKVPRNVLYGYVCQLCCRLNGY